MNLCKNKTTEIQMHINGLNITDLNITDYNPYDINDDYYSDLCRPMSKNETSATLNDKRGSFPDTNYTCSKDCSYQNIKPSTGYLSCMCDASLANNQIAPEYGKVMLDILNSTNILIIECYKTFLIFVI